MDLINNYKLLEALPDNFFMFEKINEESFKPYQISPLSYYAEEVLVHGMEPLLYTVRNRLGEIFLLYSPDLWVEVEKNINYMFNVANVISEVQLTQLRENKMPINKALFNNDQNSAFIVFEPYGNCNKSNLYYRTPKSNICADAYPRDGTLVHPSYK